ncbi:OadG family protein [Erysipelothrix urinaevulpis]|uniref:OadG family protein n=1 Tax=Erysipelothrix urinaevulpis TaxID=2683717 RepID=UPI00135844D8|nr:OadG family protein [Erysipelothrix urinaevulpis]
MEEFITVSESVIISAFSMLIVFVGLLIILAVISLLRVLSNRQNNDNKLSEESNQGSLIDVDSKVDDDEIVSVIAAALAVVMDTHTDNLVIQKITRVNNMDSWTQAGLHEHMSTKVQ